MSQKWSVKALVSYLKLKLDNDFLIQNITVVGEISNFNYHNNRHMYFTLKDDASRIPCVMFASSASRVNFKPTDGMKVNVVANVSIFEASGALQLYVTSMSEEGVGDLAAKFEKLKQTLSKEGLFDEVHKKPFVKYPNNIAVVSGRDSAALNDIKTTLQRRWPVANVDIYNTLVQGESAHLDIINNLREADSKNYDAIILARGGGSIEDLWAFNEEELARVIYNLKTPIISGVGHEIDFTISDFVSDMRAPTPTAAAELITPDIKEVTLLFKNISRTLEERMTLILNNNMQRVDMYAQSSLFKHPELLTNKYKTLIQKYKDGLYNYKERSLQQVSRYNNASSTFSKRVNDVIYKENIKLNTLESQLVFNINNYNTRIRNKFKNQLDLLDSYSPINTLKRGYSIVESDDQVVTSIENIKENDVLKIRVSDGKIMTKVVSKESNHE